MIPKISLAAAFLLMVAPPIACASNRATANTAPIACQAPESSMGSLVAQNANGIFERNQSDQGAADNGNDNDDNSKDNSDDNPTADPNQMDEQNAAGDDQAIPPQVLNGNANDPDSAPQFDQAPQPQPVNPYQ